DADVDYGSATIGTPSASLDVTELDADVSFAITVTPDTVSEELEESATFTVTLSGDPLPVGNTATVTVSVDAASTADDGTDLTPAAYAAITAAIAALTPGHGISFNGATGELTFTGGGATSLAFT